MLASTLLATAPLVFVCSCLAVAAGGEPDEAEVLPAGSPRTGSALVIPGGEFSMGDDSGWDYAPAHTVRVDSFYIDAYEVTNEQYLDLL